MALETNFKWQRATRLESKREKKAAAEAHWRDVCAKVTRREASHCRVSGKRVDPFALDPLRRGEHHHIRFRSAGGTDSTDNVILVSREIHDAIHAGKLRVEGNADEAITVWRRNPEGTWYVETRETQVGRVERD
jgi:hypothetical protein